MTKESRFERKKADTKQKIFSTAVELFLKQGYDNTTIEQIAEQADVAKRTFFNHFPTKEAVLGYLGAYRLAMAGVMLEQELSRVHSAREKIITVLRIFANENEQHKEITRLIVWETFSRKVASLGPERENQEQFRRLLTELVAEGQRQGEFRDNFEPTQGAGVLIGTYFYVLFLWLDDGLNQSLWEALESSIGVIFAGMDNKPMDRK